ncbi:MAG TPA: PLP-dependent cysteine synthase family protein [Candidatus Dormibacteraeota bacterium]|nr:PLP-dependent cysteine synthase family protein [Candidatus Dormibacteraeota bacterium]
MATTKRIAQSLHQPAGPSGRAGQSVIECIGNTPLLRLERVGTEYPHLQFLAKAEWFNPGGSVKDRPALSMIQAGLVSGTLRAGKTIIDATSGNTGIAYAMIGAALGYPVTLCLPDSASQERKRILSALGAELVMTPGDEGTDGAIRRVHEIVAANPEKYFYPDQYSNPANWQAHYDTTANEIWAQTQGAITHFVAGLGTSGTFMGVTRRLKELNPSIRCVSLQPDSAFNGLEGWKHMETAMRPAIYDDMLADENLAVGTEEAYRLVKPLAQEEGLLASPSAAAALQGCFQVAKKIPRNQQAVIVTVFADSASKYMTERFWEEL